MSKRRCCAPIQHGFETFPLLKLPGDLQRVILSYVPFREMAQLACSRKELRTVYLDRIRDRDAEVAARLESGFTAEFREGISLSETALPMDLIVYPPVREPLFLLQLFRLPFLS